MNRESMKNKTIKHNEETYKEFPPVPFWVKIKQLEYPIMIICFFDFQWSGRNWLNVDGTSLEFPYDIEWIQQDFTKSNPSYSKKWHSREEYEDEYILSKA